MVAYNCKRQLAEPIVAGTKGGTIRAERRQRLPSLRSSAFRRGASDRSVYGGHARPGEELQLYTGMRTKHCRLIARKTCVAVESIVLNFLTSQILVGGMVIWTNQALDEFARFDGFLDFGEMSNFWAEPRFDGWHIRWLPLPWERL